jgi:hypothetical protein
LANRPGLRRGIFSAQPASSFSSNPGQARMFSESIDKSGVFWAEVPRSRVLSTSRTGYGSTAEAEAVVLGPRMRGHLLTWDEAHMAKMAKRWGVGHYDVKDVAMKAIFGELDWGIEYD